MTNDYRTNLINRMIAIYGEEDRLIKEFITVCESWEENDWNNKCLQILVEAHEASPFRKEQ